MKKNYLLAGIIAFCLLLAPAAGAQTYKNSFGVTLGSFNSLSYKSFLTDRLAAQLDLGFNLTATPATIHTKAGGVSVKATGDMSYWTFEFNPELLYQSTAWRGNGQLDWYFGAGLSLGLQEDWNITATQGKWGINAALGIEYIPSSVPFTFGLDFRPGYGMLFDNASYTSVFDWKLAAAIRYYF